MSTTLYKRIPLPLLLGTGAVIFLANAGLLVLQLVGGRFLAPFIGSSVETWTCVIGVFLTGIALGNWLGGKIADRFPSPKTVAVLLILGGLSSLGMIFCYEYTLRSGFYKTIELTPRIPALAFMFCLVPALLLSLLTPLTIKLILPDVASAGRIAGLIFALSTLGCLIGNYFTGFWLMAEFSLNDITAGVGIGLIALAVPVFFFKRDASAMAAPPVETASTSPETPEVADGGWDFKNNIRAAYCVVFLASFCGMSLELAGARLLAPILGVSLFTWTGIIGVMLAGTCCGNYLGGVLADRGVGPALNRFAILMAILLGAAVGPLVCRLINEKLDCNVEGKEWLEYPLRGVGALAGILLVVPGIWLSRFRIGGYLITAIIGGMVGAVFAHTAGRAITNAIAMPWFTEFHINLSKKAGFDTGPWIIHAVGFLFGASIALLFVWDAPKRGEPISRSGALSGSLFVGALMTLAILLLVGVYTPYSFMSGGDIVRMVLAWTFGLFFMPMLLLGTISPQVIRLSVPDMKSAGRVAGSIYAISTMGAIVGTFATGYFLISTVGTFRVLMILAFVLTALAFFVGKLWKNNAMLYAATIVCGGAIFGLYLIGFGKNRYDLETKYYAIKVTPKPDYGEHAYVLALDRLWHSMVRLDDPSWLYYTHEYAQGELLLQSLAHGGETNLLIIGGGGYTFPRYVEVLLPSVKVDVVEIDPGVTEIAHLKMGLPRDTKIRTFNLDGRQFVAEKAQKHHYRLVMQDAVNDLSVPGHLMTKEYNDAVKELLTKDGAYLLTLIDSLEKGVLWRAAVHTMRETFKFVYLLGPTRLTDDEGNVNADRQVYVIYGADHPLDMDELEVVYNASKEIELNASKPAVVALAPQVPYAVKDSPWWRKKYTHMLDPQKLEELLSKGQKIILTDQYCPVDNLMSGVFRDRDKRGR